MKVLYFSRDYTPHDYRFLRAISEIGHEVWFLRLEDRGLNYERRALPGRVHVLEWGFGKDPYDPQDAERVVAALQAVWRDLSPDVIHSGPLTDATFITAKADLHPHVAMSWGFDLMRECVVSPELAHRAAFGLSRADWFLGDCFVELDAAERMGFDRDRATIFPWGIDPQRFCKGESRIRAVLAEKEDILALCLRSMEPNYQVETIVKAFIQAYMREPRLKLALMSDGSQLPMLRHLAEHSPAAKRIMFLGRRPNDMLVEYFRAADIYLSSSIVDGSSVSLLEAMACEVPALVSAIPGNMEWVEDRQTGYLFETGNAYDLALKIEWCCRNRDHLAETAERARALICEKADWDKNKFRITEAYEGAKRTCERR